MKICSLCTPLGWGSFSENPYVKPHGGWRPPRPPYMKAESDQDSTTLPNLTEHADEHVHDLSAAMVPEKSPPAGGLPPNGALPGEKPTPGSLIIVPPGNAY